MRLSFSFFFSCISELFAFFNVFLNLFLPFSPHFFVLINFVSYAVHFCHFELYEMTIIPRLLGLFVKFEWKGAHCNPNRLRRTLQN
jgi:hypothetical protein